jgi:CheY-like chemotaxis protein
VIGGGGSGTAGGIRVVLADDDATFVEALTMLVEGQGGLKVVGRAGNGLEALELVEELGPDAVVIDLHMPLLDGVTTIARLRHDQPSLCLIALTGDTDPELHEAVREAGADAVLLKTTFLQSLLDRLAEVRLAQQSL